MHRIHRFGSALVYETVLEIQSYHNPIMESEERSSNPDSDPDGYRFTSYFMGAYIRVEVETVLSSLL